MSGYKTHRFSQEPDDYEGPWPEEKTMTEWVLVPREPTPEMVLAAFDAITNASGEGMIRARWRCMLDAAPAAPQQAEPVAQIGWADEFGNLFPMGAWKPTQRTHHDSHKTAWRAVYLHPPADEVQRLARDFHRLQVAATAVTTALYDRERLFAVAELRAALAALGGGE